ncbi:MAG: carboxypeptidase-like regulatory domain-containing protein [Acidobacteriota bacterium]|nr:carboxypeptidase-like regulatory domain-containing protein [Acidobacteriota bacterium]
MKTVLAALFALFAATAAKADFPPSALTGRVLSGGAPASCVTVTIASPALQQSRTATTNAHGTYWFGALPAGTYDVTFAKAGFTSLTRPAVVEIGRVARADGTIEPSEEEESVTSTATTIDVATTPALTTRFSAEELDRLPLFDDPVSAIALTPSIEIDRLVLDDTPLFAVPFFGHEAVNELTIFRGGVPAELSGFPIVARTRSGGEDFSLAARDTYTRVFGEGGHLFESASGGRIVPERLWFFASGWTGDSTARRDVDGLLVKFTGQLAPAHHLALTVVRADYGYNPGGDSALDLASLRYTGIASERLTVEARAGALDSDVTAGARVSYRIGDHVLSAGGDRNAARVADAFYVADRWSLGSFTLDAGLRRERGHDSLLPRIGVSYDLRGNGRQAILATFSEAGAAGFFPGEARYATLGFASAIGNSGFLRADYVRRDRDGRAANDLQFQLRYSLFGRIQTGVNYGDHDVPFLVPQARARLHRGNAWLGGQLPIGEHELGLTLLERYERGWLTDAAFRYRVPVRRAALTFGVDVTNAFAHDVNASVFEPRVWRFWARVGL